MDAISKLDIGSIIACSITMCYFIGTISMNQDPLQYPILLALHYEIAVVVVVVVVVVGVVGVVDVAQMAAPGPCYSPFQAFCLCLTCFRTSVLGPSYIL